MKATERLRSRVALSADAFVELVLWRVPKPVPGSTHPFKYRLAYVVNGTCVVRYDNESETAKRLELLKALCGAGPVSIREAARRVGRDVKAVHGEVTALLKAGVIDRTDDGRIVFPYDAVKVEFVLAVA